MDLDLSLCEPYMGTTPYRVLSHHFHDQLVALQVMATHPQSGGSGAFSALWESLTGKLAWSPEQTIAMAWRPDGNEIGIKRSIFLLYYISGARKALPRLGTYSLLSKAKRTDHEQAGRASVALKRRRKKMLDMPHYVDDAFRMVKFIDYDEEVKAFERRWGGLDLDTFVRVLTEGEKEEQLIALFALGYAAEPRSRDLLLPFLHSPDPQERWASALGLGKMREEQALPVLTKMLTEFLPTPYHPFTGWEEYPYDYWRLEVASVLGAWQDPSLVPALRQAFVHIWEVTQKPPPDDKQMWFRYQDELASVLGKLGAFGALTGLTLPDYGLRVAAVYLACGHLDARARYGHLLMELQVNETLKAEVAAVLAQRFGLSEEERSYYISMYGHDSFERQVQMHKEREDAG